MSSIARLLKHPPTDPVDARMTPTMFDGDVLRISGKTYRVEPLPERPSVKAVSLHSEAGDTHDVWVTADGFAGCSCMSFTMRDGPAYRPCKHLAAVFSLAILPPPPSFEAVIKGVSNGRV